MYEVNAGDTTSIYTNDNDCCIFITRGENPLAGWAFGGFPYLEVEQLPALPFLCQSTIDDMDAEAEYLMGEYSQKMSEWKELRNAGKHESARCAYQSATDAIVWFENVTNAKANALDFGRYS